VEPEECLPRAEVSRIVEGPFLLDPSVRGLLLAFDDQACVIRYGALHDPRATDQWGAMLFTDLRAVALRGSDPHQDAWLGEAIEDGWAVQLGSSDYLMRARAQDPQRTVQDLQGHSHFVVLDGNHHVIDLVARSCLVTSIEAGPDADLASLASSITPFDW
jgi:hypothetical protein